MIRFATLHDLPQLYELCLACHQDMPYATAPVSEEKSLNQLSEFINGDKNIKLVLVSEINGKIVGALIGFIAPLFYSEAKQSYELLWWVYPEYRRKRDAVKLFLAYEYWATKLGVFAIQTSSVDGWNELTKLYLSRGFTKTETSYRKVLHGN